MIFFSLKHIVKVGAGSAVAVALLGVGVSVRAGNSELNSAKLSAYSTGKEVEFAGLFPWLSQEKPAKQEKNLLFRAVKIAPNGNGIFSGEARPGYDVFLKERETKIAFAKTDPEGLWVAVVKQPLKDKSKTYSLHSQTPDGHVQHVSRQSLEVEIPDNRMNGAMIRVIEEGQKPIVLAENLPIPAVLSVSANAAEVKGKTSSSQGISVLSSEYQDTGDDVGRVVLSGKAKKNASLRISINDSEVGVAKADKKGDWSLSEVFAIKPGAGHKLLVEQIDKSGKVLGKVETDYEGPAIADNAEEQAASNVDPEQEKKEKTFWQKVTGIFSSGAEDGKKSDNGKAAQIDVKSGEKMAADLEDKEVEKNNGTDLGSGERGAVKSKVADLRKAPDAKGKGRKAGTGSSPFVKEKSGLSGSQAARQASGTAKRSTQRARKSASRLRHKRSRRSRKSRARKTRNRRMAKLRQAKRNRAKRRKARRRNARTFRHKNRARKYSRKKSFRNRKLRLAKYRRRHRGKRLKRYSSSRHYTRMRAISRRKFRRSKRRVAAIRRNRKIRIRRGDTLWDLARIRYGHGRHYRRIYRANKKRLSSPNRITPNQRLFLPA